MLVTFVAVITLSFALIWLMPGGPAALIRAQFQEQARPMSEQEIAARVELYTSVNPDKPIPAAYLDYRSEERRVGKECRL